MTDKTVSSSKSSSKSSSSSPALEKQRPPKVLFTFLSLSLSFRVWLMMRKQSRLSQKPTKSRVFFLASLACEGTDERRGHQRKERTQKAERFERFSQTDICVAETQMKRDNTFREKRQNKKISLAFSLSLSLQSFVSSVVAFGRRYESYLKLISFFFKRSAFTTREEERRESFAYTVYIIASSWNRFPRFRRSVLRVRVRVRRARLDLPFFAAA